MSGARIGLNILFSEIERGRKQKAQKQEQRQGADLSGSYVKHSDTALTLDNL